MEEFALPNVIDFRQSQIPDVKRQHVPFLEFMDSLKSHKSAAWVWLVVSPGRTSVGFLHIRYITIFLYGKKVKNSLSACLIMKAVERRRSGEQTRTMTLHTVVKLHSEVT